MHTLSTIVRHIIFAIYNLIHKLYALIVLYMMPYLLHKQEYCECECIYKHNYIDKAQIHTYINNIYITRLVNMPPCTHVYMRSDGSHSIPTLMLYIPISRASPPLFATIAPIRPPIIHLHSPMQSYSYAHIIYDII